MWSSSSCLRGISTFTQSPEPSWDHQRLFPQYTLSMVVGYEQTGVTASTINGCLGRKYILLFPHPYCNRLCVRQSAFQISRTEPHPAHNHNPSSKGSASDVKTWISWIGIPYGCL